MPQSLALVPPPETEATVYRKPNRRPGSCSPVSYLRPRQFAGLSEKAIDVAGLVLETCSGEVAAEVAEVIRLSLLQVSAS